MERLLRICSQWWQPGDLKESKYLNEVNSHLLKKFSALSHLRFKRLQPRPVIHTIKILKWWAFPSERLQEIHPHLLIQNFGHGLIILGDMSRANKRNSNICWGRGGTWFGSSASCDELDISVKWEWHQLSCKLHKARRVPSKGCREKHLVTVHTVSTAFLLWGSR